MIGVVLRSYSGMIPETWQRYTIPAGTTVINWIIDFNERVKQLHSISQASQQGGAAALKVFAYCALLTPVRCLFNACHKLL